MRGCSGWGVVFFGHLPCQGNVVEGGPSQIWFIFSQIVTVLELGLPICPWVYNRNATACRYLDTVCLQEASAAEATADGCLGPRGYTCRARGVRAAGGIVPQSKGVCVRARVHVHVCMCEKACLLVCAMRGNEAFCINVDCDHSALQSL